MNIFDFQYQSGFWHYRHPAHFMCTCNKYFRHYCVHYFYREATAVLQQQIRQKYLAWLNHKLLNNNKKHFSKHLDGMDQKWMYKETVSCNCKIFIYFTNIWKATWCLINMKNCVLLRILIKSKVINFCGQVKNY